MGLQGRPWNDCKGEEKKTLRRMFDDLVAEAKPAFSTELEKHLNTLGVIKKP
jgi:DNA transformation protein and related proteins